MTNKQDPERPILNAPERDDDFLSSFDSEYLIWLAEQSEDKLNDFREFAVRLKSDIPNRQTNIAYLRALVSIELDLMHLRDTQSTIRSLKGDEATDLATQSNHLSQKIEEAVAILYSLGCCASNFFEKYSCRKFFPNFFKYALNVDQNPEIDSLLKTAFNKALVMMHEQLAEEYKDILSFEQYNQLLQILARFFLILNEDQVSSLLANIKFLTDQEIVIKNNAEPKGDEELTAYKERLRSQLAMYHLDPSLFPNVIRLIEDQ